MADSVQKTVIEVFCCTCNFLLFSIEKSPEDSPVLKVCNEKDPNCARPRLRYRIKQVATETISEPSQYRDADCSITHEEWDKMTPEQKAPVMKKYRFIFYREDKTPVPECIEAVNKYLESRKFAQTVPVSTAVGCYADKRCREPLKKCSNCEKRIKYDTALQAKSRRREQDLLIRRAQLRGEFKADKPPVVEVTPKVEVVAVPVALLPTAPTPVVEPQPEARRYVSLRQWLELRNQELSTMGKKHSKKQKAVKPKKVKAKKQKTVKKLAKKVKKGKKRHTEEEE